MKWRSLGHGALILLTALQMNSSRAQDDTEVYRKIKSLESLFPLPKPSEQVVVGDYFVRTGRFTSNLPRYTPKSNVATDSLVQWGMSLSMGRDSNGV